MVIRVRHQLQNQMKQGYSLALEALSTGSNASYPQKVKFARRQRKSFQLTPFMKPEVELSPDI